MEDVKMSDVYSNLPWREDGNVSFLYVEPVQNIMIAKAVNNHDRLEQEVAELREVLQATLNLSDRFVVNALTLAKHDYPLSPSAGIQLKDWKMHEKHIQQLLNK